MKRGPEKQFDRQEVLEKAMELFWNQGFEATGMSDLTRHMGIGRQSLYDTFGGKRQLFAESIRHYFQTRINRMVTILRAPGSPIENLKTMFAYMNEMAGQDRHGCMIGNSVIEFGRDDDEIAQLLRRYVEAMESEFRRLIKKARAAGEIKTETSDRDLAGLLVHTFQGMALLSQVRYDRKALKGVVRSLLAAMGAK